MRKLLGYRNVSDLIEDQLLASEQRGLPPEQTTGESRPGYVLIDVPEPAAAFLRKLGARLDTAEKAELVEDKLYDIALASIQASHEE